MSSLKIMGIIFDFVLRLGELQMQLFRSCICFRPGRAMSDIQSYSPVSCQL